MKKRDFYIMGLLVCMIGYAACHRNDASVTANNNPNKIGKQDIKTNPIEKPDSIADATIKIIKAGI